MWDWFCIPSGPNPARNRRSPAGSLKMFRAVFAQLSKLDMTSPGWVSFGGGCDGGRQISQLQILGLHKAWLTFGRHFVFVIRGSTAGLFSGGPGPPVPVDFWGVRGVRAGIIPSKRPPRLGRNKRTDLSVLQPPGLKSGFKINPRGALPVQSILPGP